MLHVDCMKYTQIFSLQTILVLQQSADGRKFLPGSLRPASSHNNGGRRRIREIFTGAA